MKLWLLRWVDPAALGKLDGSRQTERYKGYDCSGGFVVRALHPKHARALVARRGRGKKHYGDEGREVWLDPTQSSCVELTAEGEAGVILRDHLTG